MSKLEVAKQFIRDQEFDYAYEVLKNHHEDQESTYLLSLLCRLKDDYEFEQTVIEQTENNAYIQERKKWHALPLFEKLAPRKPLHLERDPEKTPDQSILEQLCIVTAGGSDQPYFNLLIQLLESLADTRLYKDIPIFILDAGITEEDKHYLTTRFNNITIKDPGWDFPCFPYKLIRQNQHTENGMKGCTARPFINKHFPGYRYYIWADTDVWFQDERSIDTLILQTLKSQVVAPEWPRHWEESWWRFRCDEFNIVPHHYYEVFSNKQVITAGTFCVDNNTGFFELWAEYMQECYRYNQYLWGPDELAFMYTFYKHFPSSKSFPMDFQCALNTRFGNPIYDNGILLCPISGKLVGSVHLMGFDKNVFFVPMKTPQDDTVNASVQYRTWPWADKEEIKQMLQSQEFSV